MNIESMVGKVFTSVEQTKEYGQNVLIFENDEEQYKFTHDRECCESVWIESIVGDLDDLIGNPILLAEEATNYQPVDDYGSIGT